MTLEVQQGNAVQDCNLMSPHTMLQNLPAIRDCMEAVRGWPLELTHMETCKQEVRNLSQL